jgi:hypothetical protein
VELAAVRTCGGVSLTLCMTRLQVLCRAGHHCSERGDRPSYRRLPAHAQVRQDRRHSRALCDTDAVHRLSAEGVMMRPCCGCTPEKGHSVTRGSRPDSAPVGVEESGESKLHYHVNDGCHGSFNVVLIKGNPPLQPQILLRAKVREAT